MAYTQSDLDSIDAAIASGELEVAYSDRRIKYRSMNELRQARAYVASQLSTSRRSKQFRVAVSKGL